MPSQRQVAMSVRKNKDAYPENYCAVPDCLWRVLKFDGSKPVGEQWYTDPCPKPGHAARRP